MKHLSQQPSDNRQESGAKGSYRDSREAPSLDRYSSSRQIRIDSDANGAASSGAFSETLQSTTQWRHGYDVHAMETSPGSPRAISRNPIPAPTVTVRSEYPTISRSRQQQTLTCLVTVEVAENKWRPDPEDVGSCHQTPRVLANIDEIATQYVAPTPTPNSKSRFIPYESPEVLRMMTNNLRTRVDNWHGLDFSR